MWLPGDRPKQNDISRMIRVDHAGEYGAKRIYQGQLSVLKGRARDTVQEMLDQEEAHLAAFDDLIRTRRVRPTALMPLWHVGGWLLGAVTARLGTEAAMACTVAVESVIDSHYAEQEEALANTPEEAPLATAIAAFRADEQHHHATGLAEGAEAAPLFGLLHGGIAALTKASVWLATRI